MFKVLVVTAAMLGSGVVGVELASAQTSPPAQDQAASENKTSDRTPGNQAPDRAEGANRAGAAGTDAGLTAHGTSDRTPSDQATTTDATGKARGALFTEEQARMHLARLGYTNVSELTKDESGAWRGSAMKDGKTIMVGVDVKGNVALN